MKIIESIQAAKDYCQQLKRDGKTIASVDTDAELHDGHMALVKIAKENSDVVVLNAGHSVDYKEKSDKEYKKGLLQYRQRPDGLSRDIELAKSNGVDVFFYPSMNQLYVDDLSLPIEMCEKTYDLIFKPEAIVTPPAPPTVVSSRNSTKVHILSTFFPIFNIVTPDISVVGQKDVYQNFALKSLIKQLRLPIKVVVCPTIRDSDGLAFSSRNRFLTKVQRERASSVYKSLQEVSRLTSYPSVKVLKRKIFNNIKNAHGSVSYIKIVCAETVRDLDVVDRPAVVVIAATFGKVYLWDNILISPK